MIKKYDYIEWRADSVEEKDNFVIYLSILYGKHPQPIDGYSNSILWVKDEMISFCLKDSFSNVFASRIYINEKNNIEKIVADFNNLGL
jgi:hypothetical protein